MILSRRSLLLGTVTSLSSACSRPGGIPGVLRFGVMTNLTHAPVLAAIRDGSLARAIAPTQLEVKYFRAGPRVTEALLGGAIDFGTAGTGAVISATNRHPKKLIAPSCIASGGASLITRASITRVDQLEGTTLAVAQLGTTQDVSLRTYLRQKGLALHQSGGSVRITALGPADILNQFKRGALDGAWMAEPWATRAVREAGFVRFIDERELWPDRYFPTALLVARSEFIVARPLEATRLKDAITRYVVLAQTDPAQVRSKAYEELVVRVKNPGKRPVFDEAWSYVDFRSDLRDETMVTLKQNAIDAGLLRAR